VDSNHRHPPCKDDERAEVRGVEAERQFRRVNGYRDLYILARALECRREVLEEARRVI
jgi:hypothetical protein